MTQIDKVGVVGAGTMGNGIAQVFAAAGFEVVMEDVSEEALARSLTTIEKNLDRLLAKNKIGARDKEATLGRIATSTDLNALADTDLVVEAAAEDPQIKLGLFRQLDRTCKTRTGAFPFSG